MENNETVFKTTNPELQKLHKEADDIQSFMGIPARIDDPASLTYRLKDLDVYMARLSDMMIRAKTMKERAQYEYITANEDKLNKLAATVSNRMISSFLFEYTMTYSRLETMYRTMEHISRNLVSQISYIKQMMIAGI